MTAAGDPSQPIIPTPSPRLRTWPRKALAATALLGALGTLWIKDFVLDATPQQASARPAITARSDQFGSARDANAASATTRASQQDEWSNKPVVAMRRNLFAIPTANADAASRPMIRPTAPVVPQVVQAPTPPLPAPPVQQPQTIQPATEPSSQTPPQPQQVIVVMPNSSQPTTSGNGIQHGLSRSSRDALAQSAYQDALDELSATNPDLNTALWHLDAAINFKPDFADAITLREKINGQLVAQSSGAVVDDFLRSRMLAGQTTRPAGGQQ